MLGVVMGVQTVHDGQFGDSSSLSQTGAGKTFCKYNQHQLTKWGEIIAIKHNIVLTGTSASVIQQCLYSAVSQQ